MKPMTLITYSESAISQEVVDTTWVARLSALEIYQADDWTNIWYQRFAILNQIPRSFTLLVCQLVCVRFPTKCRFSRSAFEDIHNLDEQPKGWCFFGVTLAILGKVPKQKTGLWPTQGSICKDDAQSNIPLKALHPAVQARSHHMETKRVQKHATETGKIKHTLASS